MKLGAEPKKMAVLGGLVVVGGYLFYANVLTQPGPPPEARNTPAAAAPAPVSAALPVTPSAAPQPSIRRAGSRTRPGDEFRPSLRRREDEQLDPTTIDPTLRLDLLAKVQATGLQGGARNLFAFSTPPPPPAPKTPEPKIMPKMPGAPAAPVNTGPPPPPPPPPIPLKYYGFSSVRGTAAKTAFFLDGDDILVAGEGQTVKRRYKVVRIGVNSVVMEDTESKSQQTLPLAEDAVVG